MMTASIDRHCTVGEVEQRAKDHVDMIEDCLGNIQNWLAHEVDAARADEWEPDEEIRVVAEMDTHGNILLSHVCGDSSAVPYSGTEEVHLLDTAEDLHWTAVSLVKQCLDSWNPSRTRT